MIWRLTAALGVALTSLACADDSHPPYADDAPVSVRPVQTNADAGDATTPPMVVATLPEGPDTFDGETLDKDHVYFYGYLPVREDLAKCYPTSGQAALGHFSYPDKAYGAMVCDLTAAHYIGHDGQLRSPLAHKRVLLHEAQWEENDEGAPVVTEELPTDSESTSPDIYPTTRKCYTTSTTVAMETPDPDRYVIACITPPAGSGFVPDVIGLIWNDGTDMHTETRVEAIAVDMDGNALMADQGGTFDLFLVSAEGERTEIAGELLPDARPLHARAVSGGGFWVLFRSGGLKRVKIETDGSVTESVQLASLPNLEGIKYTGTDGRQYDAGIGLDYRFCVLSGQGEAYCPGIYGSSADMDRSHVLMYMGEMGEALVLLPEWLSNPRVPLAAQPQLLPPLRAITGRW